MLILRASIHQLQYLESTAKGGNYSYQVRSLKVLFNLTRQSVMPLRVKYKLLGHHALDFKSCFTKALQIQIRRAVAFQLT
jgi:hypothetical protein